MTGDADSAQETGKRRDGRPGLNPHASLFSSLLSSAAPQLLSSWAPRLLSS